MVQGELRGRDASKRQAGQPVQASGVEMNGFFPFFPEVPRDSQEQGVGRTRPQRRRLSLSTGAGEHR